MTPNQAETILAVGVAVFVMAAALLVVFLLSGNRALDDAHDLHDIEED